MLNYNLNQDFMQVLSDKHLTEDVFVLDICVDEQITINRVGL